MGYNCNHQAGRHRERLVPMAGGDLQLSYQPDNQSYSYVYSALRLFATTVTGKYSSAIKLIWI